MTYIYKQTISDFHKPSELKRKRSLETKSDAKKIKGETKLLKLISNSEGLISYSELKIITVRYYLARFYTQQ